MSADMHIRQARSADFQALMQLYRQLQPHDPVLTDGSDRYTFEIILQADGLHLFVAELEHTLDFAWRAGCYKAMLQTGSKKASTHAFYKACGFSPDEKTGYLARPSEARPSEARPSEARPSRTPN